MLPLMHGQLQCENGSLLKHGEAQAEADEAHGGTVGSATGVDI